MGLEELAQDRLEVEEGPSVSEMFWGPEDGAGKSFQGERGRRVTLKLGFKG